ncbi:MAG: signal recognition particle protein [Verrucomicrobia bacterium]|nr:MAG: signal recognition particle protein [Verrucomicrobiota bacterium]
MFETLTERLSKAVRNIRGVGKLTEDNITDALKEVRTALLSADVHFRVAREFVDRVKEKCLGQEVTRSITPGQQIVKVINDELVSLLGEGTTALSSKRPLKIMLVGLQGGGKTTTAAKLGLHLRKAAYKPLLVACDIYRPAAIDQLEILARQESFEFYGDRESRNVPAIAAAAEKAAAKSDANAIIFDTAGRIQIDENLIQEIVDLRDRVKPDEVLLVADGALGQEAVNVAKAFNEAVSLTGLILTKMDGDARGGAALSMKEVTGCPIKFLGTGEKTADLEVFYPERMASRILGMGDVVSLVEKAQESIDQDEAQQMAEKLRKADFNFEDFLGQMKQLKKMGPLEGIMGMLPGMSGMKIGDDAEGKMQKAEAIVQSMTLYERRNPNIMNGSRRLRIAKGSGTKVSDVNSLIKQFTQMRKMMKKMKGGGMKKMMRQMGGMGASGGMPKF